MEDEENNWDVDPDDLQLDSIIGEGSTATVYLGFLRGTKVAVKEMQVENSESILEIIQRELKVLSKVTHPNILSFVGLVTEAPPLRLCLEYCDGGSLFELLHNQWTTPLSWLQRLKILLETASAGDYLHNFDPPVIHRDLKSLNLLLLHRVTKEIDNPHIKLADFGFARCFDATMTQGAGTSHWRAPEVSSGTDYTEKADIFSFAMIAYEVVCRHVPFETLDSVHVSRQIQQGVRPEMESACESLQVPDGLIPLISRCWDQDPMLRPSFHEIRQEVSLVATKMPDEIGLCTPPPSTS